METRRVAVTGLGAIAAPGRNAAEFWQALSEGRPAIGPIEAVDRSAFRFQNAAEVRALAIQDEEPRQMAAENRRRVIDHAFVVVMVAGYEVIGSQASRHKP